MSETKILSKTLSNGTQCSIAIEPDPSRLVDDSATTLSWWLRVTVGTKSGLIKAHPHEIANPRDERTHALTLPVLVGPKGAKVIGLTADEAQRIDKALTAWVDGRKAANAQARDELVARVRAAAPDAPTWTVSSPHGGPGVADTWRLDDGKVITCLRTWEREIQEDGWSFGLQSESGTLYYSEVRAATAEEAAPLLALDAKRERRAALGRQLDELYGQLVSEFGTAK